jgi:hypothetical protein
LEQKPLNLEAAGSKTNSPDVATWRHPAAQHCVRRRCVGAVSFSLQAHENAVTLPSLR